MTTCLMDVVDLITSHPFYHYSSTMKTSLSILLISLVASAHAFTSSFVGFQSPALVARGGGSASSNTPLSMAMERTYIMVRTCPL